MASEEEQLRVQTQAAEIVAELAAWKGRGTGCKNGARVRIRQQFKGDSGPYVLALARELAHADPEVHVRCRWFSYCLARYHPQSFQSLDDAQVEALGQDIDSQDTVDNYARILAGPAWLHSLVSDDLIRRWARSEDRWWRRAALVSTVALNIRGADGGTGDTPRTLAICCMLVDEREDMLCQALSWALRALAVRDAQAVRVFVAAHADHLAAQVLRDVTQALDAGHHSGRGLG